MRLALVRRIFRGLNIRVVAAGKVPRASGDRVKTDKRDAERRLGCSQRAVPSGDESARNIRLDLCFTREGEDGRARRVVAWPHWGGGDQGFVSGAPVR